VAVVTGPEFVLGAVFAAVWLAPLALTVLWEVRNRRLRSAAGLGYDGLPSGAERPPVDDTP
jgi:hypothetical protein